MTSNEIFTTPYFFNGLVPYFFLMGTFNSSSAMSMIAVRAKVTAPWPVPFEGFMTFLGSLSVDSFCSITDKCTVFNTLDADLAFLETHHPPINRRTADAMFFERARYPDRPIRYSLMIRCFISMIYTFMCKPISGRDNSHCVSYIHFLNH